MIQQQEQKLVIGYCRVSAVSSVKDGESIPRQMELIKAYAQLKALPEPKFYIDEAISGAKESRPGLNEVLQLCREKKVAVVIVSDLSRLARNLKLTLEVIDLFVKQQITFVSLSEDIRTDTAMGKFFISLCAAFHQMTRDNISDRQKIFIKHKKDKGEKIGGYVPYGFVVIGKKLMPDIHEQAIIKKIIELNRAGYSGKAIARTLFKMGIKTKLGRTTWSVAAIKRIIKRHGTENLNNAA